MKQLPILVDYTYKNGRRGDCYLGRHGLYDDHDPKGELDFGGAFELSMVKEVRKWIRRNMKELSKFDYVEDSYALKHICEADCSIQYVANGEFIYAMVLEGYRVVRPHTYSATCCFNAKRTGHSEVYDRGIYI